MTGEKSSAEFNLCNYAGNQFVNIYFDVKAGKDMYDYKKIISVVYYKNSPVYYYLDEECLKVSQ